MDVSEPIACGAGYRPVNGQALPSRERHALAASPRGKIRSRDSGRIKFLHVLCTRWPRGAAAGTLMVNATEIGRQLSLSADESKAIADSLHQQGLSHARSIEGVVLSIRPRRA